MSTVQNDRSHHPAMLHGRSGRAGQHAFCAAAAPKDTWEGRSGMWVVSQEAFLGARTQHGTAVGRILREVVGTAPDYQFSFASLWTLLLDLFTVTLQFQQVLVKSRRTPYTLLCSAQSSRPSAYIQGRHVLFRDLALNVVGHRSSRHLLAIKGGEPYVAELTHEMGKKEFSLCLYQIHTSCENERESRWPLRVRNDCL